METKDPLSFFEEADYDRGTILEHLPRLIMFIDKEGEIVYWNQAVSELTGYLPKELSQKRIWELLPGFKKGNFMEQWHQLQQGKQISRQTRINHRDGAVVWIDLKERMVELKEGNEIILCSASDISTFVKTEREFALSEARMQAILDTAVEGIITIDQRGIIQSFNQSAEEMFGYRAQEVIGEKVNILMPAPYRQHHDDYIQNYLETGEKKIIGIGREVRGKRKNGEIFPMELAVSEVQFRGDIIFTGIARDISERRRLENEILQISEEERQKIGRDLHDGLGQMLTGIGLVARNVARRLKEEGHPAADDVTEISQMLKEADEQARNLSHGLVHSELEGESTQAVLQQLVKRSQRLYDIECRCSVDPSIDIKDKMTTLHLYRIAQEAIRNAVKHGKAETVDVSLKRNGDYLQLIIEDDGVGFSKPEEDLKGKGIGLNTMKYRANLLGGYLHLRESPEGNTMVDCYLPVQELLNT